MRVSYAIVFVSDMKQSVAFYRDIVGLPLRFESAGWSEFGTDGATLALHQEGAPRRESDSPQALAAGQCRPGIAVPDVDRFHERMVSMRVRCVQEPKTVFGSRVAQYADPDGLVFSVGEDRRPA
jgi:lactoylglutathione lyase